MIAERAVFDPMNQQAIYRRLLESTGFPGRVCRLEEWLGEDAAWLAVLATLADGAVGVHDASGLMGDDLWRLLETERSGVRDAAFILAQGAEPPRAGLEPNLGTLNRPEFGATLVLTVDRLVAGAAGLTLRLRGPGIRTESTLGVDGLHGAWIEARQHWCRAFPLGVDLVLCDAAGVVTLPRTTVIEQAGGAAGGAG